MEMIWQYDNRVGREGMALAGRANRRAQDFSILCQQPQPPVGKIDRKEEATAGDKIATVCGHDLLA
jgi:hypothetical protein